MSEKQTPPPQQQEQPGSEEQMHPQPVFISDEYRSGGKLQGKVAVVTGADSGIGRAAGVHFAREGAKMALVYLDSHGDARKPEEQIRKAGGEVITFEGDVADEGFCQNVVQEVTGKWGRIDILVNNAGEQHPQEKLEDITAEQWQQTFR